MTLFAERQKLVQRYVKAIVKDYIERHILGEEVKRTCVYCGTRFKAHSSRHVCCSADCRRGWYSGQFFPRSD